MYPDKTLEEIKNIKDRPYVKHYNELKSGQTLKMHWIKNKKKLYTFLPVTSVEAHIGRKANTGGDGNMLLVDFNIYIKNIKRYE